MAVAKVLLLLLFCTVCSLSAALDDDSRASSPPVDPGEGGLGEAVGQVGEEAPHGRPLDDEEALFSPEGKKNLYKLPPEEAKKELRRMIDRIDRDGNEELSREELILQLELVDRAYFQQDLEQQWPQVDLDGDDYITRQEYDESMGKGDFMATDVAGNIDGEERTDRFKQADSDGDGKLSKEEFDALLHPDLHEHMIQHLIDDHLRQHDTDHDGFISLDEYMAIYSRAMEGSHMPDWVLQEKKEFEEMFDKNKDGKLDHEEMRDWIAPSSAQYAADEADHILHEADKNEDGVLTMEEIMEKYELFRDSELTDVWHMGHDEL